MKNTLKINHVIFLLLAVFTILGIVFYSASNYFEQKIVMKWFVNSWKKRIILN